MPQLSQVQSCLIDLLGGLALFKHFLEQAQLGTLASEGGFLHAELVRSKHALVHQLVRQIGQAHFDQPTLGNHNNLIVSFNYCESVKQAVPMNLEQLGHNRLKISLNVLERDPTVAEPIKTIFKQILQFLNDNSLHLSLIEQQLAHKAHSAELAYGMSQKLSALEFLQYFNKVEKLMENIQRNQKKEQEKIQNIVKEQDIKLQGLDKRMQALSREWERRKKSEALDQETWLTEIDKVRRKVDRLKVEGGKQNLCQNSQLGDMKLLQQLREVEKCCFEMKQTINLLVDGLNAPCRRNGEKLKFVTFDDLRLVLAELEANLNTSLSRCLADHQANIRSKLNPNLEYTLNPKTSKIEHDSVAEEPQFDKLVTLPSTRNILDQISCSELALHLKWSYEDERPMQISSPHIRIQNSGQNPNFKYRSPYPYEIEASSVGIRQQGFYQIACGFEHRHAVEFKLISNGETIACHHFTDMPQNLVCRAIMVYLKVCSAGTRLSLQYEPKEPNENEVVSKRRKTNAEVRRNTTGFLYILRLA